MTAATSPLRLSSLVCAHITSYPSACSDGITLLKHDPSAHSPCANTMLGFCDTIDLPLYWCASQDGDRAQPRNWGGPRNRRWRRRAATGSISGIVQSAIPSRSSAGPRRPPRVDGTPLLVTGIVTSGGASP